MNDKRTPTGERFVIEHHYFSFTERCKIWARLVWLSVITPPDKYQVDWVAVGPDDPRFKDAMFNVVTVSSGVF